jgi:autotransporter-associated beta strand protein
VISNTGSLVKTNGGTLILSGANTYSGTTLITNGVLNIQNNTALGATNSGTTVGSGAALELQGGITNGAEALALNGTGISSGGALRNVSGDNTYGGTITNVTASRINSDAGTLTLSGAVNANALALTFGGAGNIAANGAITNSASTVTKDGAGTLTLAASNTYSGGTTINAGTVAISNAASFGSNTVTFASNNTTVAALAGVLFTNNIALTGDGTVDVGSFNLTNSGIISNTGSLTKAGAGTLILGRANTYSGGTTINAGTVAISNAASFGSNTVTFASNGTKMVALANMLVTNTYALTGNGTMDVGANLVMTNSGAISGAGGLTKSGTGTVVLSASNNFSGTTTLSAGVLSLANTNALSASTLDHSSAGSVSFSNLTGANLGGLQGSTGITLTNLAGTAVALNVGGNNSSTTYSGALSGGGSLTKSGAGTLALSGANTYSGGTLVSAGALSGDSSSLRGNITNSAAVVFNQSTNGTYAGVLSGGGSLAKNGAGTLILSASNSFSGGTLLNSGTLSAGNAFAFGSGSVTLTNGTTLNLSNFSIANTLINNGGTLTNVGTVSGAELNAGTTSLSSSNSTVAEVSGTATVDVSGANTTITNMTGGTVNVAATSTNSTLQTVSGGTVNASTNITVQTYNGGNIGVTNGSSVAIASGNSAGSISGAGNLIKTGSGILTLSGNNTFSGAMTISNGVVSISTNAALAGTSVINMNTNTTLAYTGGSATLDRNISVTNGTGTIQNTGGGTLTLAGSLSKNGTVLVFSNGAFNVTGVISGSSANSDLVVDNATVTLSNANSYNGPTYIRNAGNLTAAVIGAMPTNTRSAVIMDDSGSGSSVFNVTASQQIASLTGAASSTNTIATNTSLTIGTSSGNTTFAGVISGGGTLVKAGASTQTLSGANTYSGGTLVSGGLLSGNTTSLQGSITNNAAVAFSQSTNGTYSGVMSGSGSLTKNGTGILTLSSSNSFSGGTTITEGELHVNSAGGLGTGSVALTGTNAGSRAALHYSNTLTPLSVGALTLSGNAAIDLQALCSIQSTGAITVNGTNNYISLGGANWNLGTNTLVSGTSLTLNGGSSILLTGTTLNEGALGLGSTTNIGRSSFTFGSNSTSFYVTTAGVAFDVVWSGAQNSLWNTNAANWQQATNGLNPSGTNIAFATDDDAFFGNAATASAITVDTGGVQAAEMYVTNSSGTVTFNGASLAAHDLTKTGAGNLTISNSLALIGNDAAGPISGVFSNSGSGNVTLAGAFTEGSLVQNGAGTVTLSGANSYAGGTTLSAGALRIGNTSALGTGALVQSDGTSTLQINAGGTIANSMALYKVAFLNGGNTLSGTITNMNTVYDVAAGTTNTLSGFVTGPGGLELVGGGVLAVTGATNNYAAATTISNGTLRVGTLANAGSASSIGTNGSIVLAGSTPTNAVFDYTGGNVTIDRSLVLNNGGGTVAMALPSTTMTMTGSASGSGALVLSEGTMVLSNTGTPDSFAPASIQVDSGATLQLGANNQIGNSTGLILNGGTFIVGTSTSGYSETLGTLTLSASSTIDLGSYATGLRQLTFADSSAITWSGTLTIANWQGLTRQSSDVAEILFGTGGLTSTQLGQIYFANQNINGGVLVGASGELAPIPEAEVYWGALAVVLAIAYRERRRLIAILQQIRR